MLVNDGARAESEALVKQMNERLVRWACGFYLDDGAVERQMIPGTKPLSA